MGMSLSPGVVTNGLVFYYDMYNTQKSFKGAPTTNLVSSASTFGGWSNYWRTDYINTFQTEFGTTGYRISGNPSWNGLYRGITLPSTGTYTFSAWFRYWGGTGNNNGATVYVSGWGGGDSANGLDKSKVGVWQRVSLTLNCTNTSMTFYIISYGGDSSGRADCSTWDVTMPQVESGSFATGFVDGTRYSNFNLESSPSYPSWNATAGSSASGGTLTFSGGSYNSKSSWDLYKTYSGLSTGTNYTWSALVKVGTASNLIITMNNTQNWNTGPSVVVTGLSSTAWTRVSITGTTNTGSFNLHLGASFNTEVASTSQSAGTVFIQDVRLVLSQSQTAISDLIGQSTIIPQNLTYNSDSTFNFTYSNPSYITIPLASAFNKTEGTMNFWVYPTRYNGGNGYFVNREDSTPNATDWFWIGPYSDTFYFRLGNGSDCCSNDLSFGSVSSVIPLNTWTNMCFSWKANNTSVIYKNGVLLTSRSIGNVPSTNPASNGRIGLGHSNADDYFHGRMPLVQIYNRQLSAVEVFQNFNSMRGLYGI